MSVSVIANRDALNKVSDKNQDKISKQEISESERIKAIALLCLGGFLISWATFELFGRSSCEGCEEAYNSFQKFCYTQPSWFACPSNAISSAVDCTMKAAYEKVGSFWLTVGLYLVPAIFSIRRILKEASAEKIKNGAIPSSNLDEQNGSALKSPENTSRKPLERIVVTIQIPPNDSLKT